MEQFAKIVEALGKWHSAHIIVHIAEERTSIFEAMEKIQNLLWSVVLIAPAATPKHLDMWAFF